MLSERTQVLLSPAQRQRLERMAAERAVPMGVVIREAIEAYLVPVRRSRAEALDELFSIEAPVSDWDQMKAEIEAGALS